METTIYILRLTGDNWYIGRTDNFQKRYQEHFEGKGSAWTKKFPPVAVETVFKGMSRYDEDRITKEYMALYGIDKVRGGTYVSVQLDDETVKMLTKEIRNANDLCLRCGRSGHFIGTCYTGTDVHGRKLEKKKEEQLCTRCGRSNHLVSDCTYKTTVDRKKIVDFAAPKPSKHLCTRCGRDTHPTEECTCKTTVDGKRLDRPVCGRCGRDTHTTEKCTCKTTVDGKRLDRCGKTTTGQ